MLMAIRDRVTGVALWIICGIIIIPFLLFGITDYIGIGNEPAAIKFNDAEMTMREFERRMQLNRQQQAQRFGGELPEIFDNNDMFRRQIADQFIRREARVQYVQEHNYGSSAEEIYRNIAALPQFQLDGEFSRDTYRRQIASRNGTEENFEKQVEFDIAIGQLEQGIISTALATDEQLNNYVRLRNQSRDFEYFVLDIDNYKKQVSLSEDEVKSYYDENKSSFMTEKQVSLNYLELKKSDIAAEIQVDDQTLEELYASNSIPGIADKPETRQASHILLLVDETASEEDVAAKEKKMQEIRTRALTEDFAALAKEFSEDAGSAATGGDLGAVPRGIMAKPFDDTLFSMQVGELSEVVKTQFGFHIIKLAKVNEASKPSFADVKAKIRAAYKDQEAEKVFFEKADQLSNLTFEQPDTLDAAVQELGLSIKTTPLFTETTGTGIAANNKVRSTAFTNELLLDGLNSEAIEVDENHVAVIRVADYKPSREKTLEESKQEIEASLLNEKAITLIEQDAGKVFANADSDWQKLAKDYGSQLESVKSISRESADVEREIVEQAFLGSDFNAPMKALLNNGSVALIKVLSLKDGSYASLSDEEKGRIENEWLVINGRSDFDSIVESYKDKAKVVYNPDLNILVEN